MLQQVEFCFGILATSDDGLLFELMAGHALSLKYQDKDKPADFVRPVCLLVLDNTFPFKKRQAAESEISHQVQMLLRLDGVNQYLDVGVAGGTA